jgi:cytochrome c oxidase subunit IV
MNTKEKQSGFPATYLAVYTVIIMLSLAQILFAYETGPQLAFMLMVAFIQAGLAVLFFMNLAKERPTLMLALIPATLFVLFMMNIVWSDSFRLLMMRPFAK